LIINVKQVNATQKDDDTFFTALIVGGLIAIVVALIVRLQKNKSIYSFQNIDSNLNISPYYKHNSIFQQSINQNNSNNDLVRYSIRF